MELWTQQQRIAQGQQSLQGSVGLDSWLLATFPDLEQTATGDIEIRESARERLDRLAGGRMRMFIAEGVFFALILLGGIYYMYRTLQEEVAVEHRQSIFLSATSHELKTPITAIRLYLDTLTSRELSAQKQAELLSKMGYDLTRLSDLIERLLLAQAVINPSHTPQLVALDLSEAVKHVLGELEQRAESDGLTIESSIADDLTALADPERWQLVVSNLLDNAIKYTPRGGHIGIRLSASGDWVRLTVEDSGIGFEPEESEQIFGRFYRIGNEDTRKAKGTGLGLYLVREIAQSFGGRAWAESEGLNRGSTFYVEVPLVLSSRT